MKKADAQLVIDLIHATEAYPEFISVENVVQSTIDKYIDNLIKNKPEIKYKTIKTDTERKMNNFIRQFEVAFQKKLKKLGEEHHINPEPKPIKEEKQYLIKEASAILNMTPQNLNHLLRKHPEINIIEISSRKRYLTENELNKLKKINK
ncbi:MerR family transcriptional regulator [Mangrovimonas sp. YM274]|uniref:MerR family transcriptional regulator n=1 Tax=Mangrovimonas sp. YM274 TaxID=3070660 RepID=UPI0027DDFE60|nr:MerR family transcriptional regulator [Mangrovimonas sp. YM274]WMI68806.1 MerR family transcriptional regulator [Mangrovimonas sp. YM274]